MNNKLFVFSLLLVLYWLHNTILVYHLHFIPNVEQLKEPFNREDILELPRINIPTNTFDRLFSSIPFENDIIFM